MRVVRSSSALPVALLGLSILIVGCKGGATNGASTNAGNANANAAQPDGAKVEIKTTQPGTGVAAKNGDLLAMRYTGRLTNGEVFDSNTTKQPLNLVLGSGSVIKGWEEGLQGIKIGEKRSLKIPSSKAYGEQGNDKIPPNSELVFDIECLDVLPAGDMDKIARETLRPGTGAELKTGQTVTFNFRGLLVDGTEFDSSYKGQPVTVELGAGRLNPAALDDAMVGLKVGGKYRLKFPPQFAFGAQGSQSTKVPGNSVVYFIVEPTAAK
ncbi:FKBP-type peptidyl-prolyl cis-trans isomerase [bacterium]|nr:MAG: FKBP-type peptidyl-prolyl cis-trans isomerase [bacterium]